MLRAREPRTQRAGASEHSERIPAQAKCPRSNTRKDGIQSERKKRTVGRAASAMSRHYAQVRWLDSARYPTTWESAALGRAASISPTRDTDNIQQY